MITTVVSTMKPKRHLIADISERTGVLEALLRARQYAFNPWLTVLTYHRVHYPERDFLFDEDVVDTTPEEFAAQLRFYKRYFSLIGLDDLREYLFKGRALPRNALMLTFDDGYLDNVTNALPLLLEHRVRALFFIATEFVTSRRLFWWDRINYVMKQSTQGTVRVTYPRTMTFDRGRDCAQAIELALTLVKTEYALDVDRFLDELTVASGITWNRNIERSLVDALIMRWDQVRELRRSGMDVQSHTHTHRVLQTLPNEPLRADLVTAKQILETELREPIVALSYPVGKPVCALPHIVEALETSGYELGFTNATGSSRRSRTLNRFDIARISMARNIPPSFFRGMMAFPPLAYRA